MPAAVLIRTDYSASQLRRLASRDEAAPIGGMDRQTLRDWARRFNAEGPDGLKDIRSKGHPPRPTLGQLGRLRQDRRDRARDGAVRWRRIDLKVNPPVKTAGQRGLARLGVGSRDQALARAATSAVSHWASSASGSKSSPIHSVNSAWRSCLGSLKASSSSA